MDGQSLQDEVNRLIAEKHNPTWMCLMLSRSVELARSRSPNAISAVDVLNAFICVVEREAATFRNAYKIGYVAKEPQRTILVGDARHPRPVVQRRKRRR